MEVPSPSPRDSGPHLPPAQYEDLYALTTGIYVNAYSFEELCQVINQYTPQATLEDLTRLAGAYSEEAIRSRRGQ